MKSFKIFESMNIEEKLFYSLRMEDYKTAEQILIKNKKLANKIISGDDTVLCYSIYNYLDSGFVYFLIDDVGADINQSDYYGNTPLVCSVLVFRVNIFNKLLDMGAVVNTKDRVGYNALLSMCVVDKYLFNENVKNFKYIFKKLLENGIDYELKAPVGDGKKHNFIDILCDRQQNFLSENIDFIINCYVDVNYKKFVIKELKKYGFKIPDDHYDIDLGLELGTI